MHKLLVAIALLLLLPSGVAMAMTAADKKEEKKEEKKEDGKDKGQKPIVIIIWEKAWPIVIREVSEQTTNETLFVLNEEL